MSTIGRHQSTGRVYRRKWVCVALAPLPTESGSYTAGALGEGGAIVSQNPYTIFWLWYAYQIRIHLMETGNFVINFNFNNRSWNRCIVYIK